MPKTKAKAKTPFVINKTRLFSILSIMSFVGMLLLWISFISFANTVNQQNNTNVDGISKLFLQTAEHQYCIDNAVKPCSQATIAAHAESQQNASK